MFSFELLWLLLTSIVSCVGNVQEAGKVTGNAFLNQKLRKRVGLHELK